MQEILPRLFLGPYASGKRREDLKVPPYQEEPCLETLLRLQANNITHIMIVRSAIERIIAAKYPDEFQYHIVEIPDVPTVSLLQHLQDCKRFIDEGRTAGGVLIHWFESKSNPILLRGIYLTCINPVQ